MANEKLLNTRIQLKYDSYEAWEKSSVILKAGEIAIAHLGPANKDNSTHDSGQHPVLFKVGDNTHTFAQLPWASALAADVYAWAKQSEHNFVNTFLALKMDDGTTMQSKLDSVFATDEALSKAIEDLRKEIPTALGVMSVKVEDDDIVIGTPTEKTDGDVTIQLSHKKYDKAGTTSDVDGDATTAGSSVTIKVPTLTVDAYGHTEFNGETSHTITIPNEVAVGDGTVTIEAGTGLTAGGSFNVNQDNDATITLNHQAKPTTGTAETATDGTGRTYVTEVLVDALGHIAGVKTATETVVDTNTAHTHKAGSGIKLDLTEPNVNGGVEGEVKLDLNIAMELSDKEIKIYDKDDTTKTAIATLDATSFIKDGMIESVELVQADAAGNQGQFLKITWNIDDAHSTDEGAEKDVTYVNVGDLVDVYTAAPGADEVQVAISNTNVISATLVNGSITEAKLAEAVTTKLNKTWEEVGVAKGLVDALAATHATDKAALEQAIEAAKADASTKDAVVLAEAQKGIAEVQGNLTAHAENTDIHVSTTEKEAWNQKLESVTAAQDGGLVATPNAETNSVSLAIDDSITWVFYCGSSTDVI